MKNLFSFALISSFVMLAACHPIYETKFNYQPPRSDIGKMCAAQCAQTKIFCQQANDLRNQNCEVNARHEAKARYSEYKRTQKAAGKSIDRTVDDFDYSYCNESNNCTDVYNQCYQTCGGAITSYQICTAFCDKK